MRKLKGFSLMEMMVVLTIVAIIAAISAPMISKNMSQNIQNNSANGNCAWHRPAKDPDSIAFNYITGDKQNKITASIGKLIYTFSTNKPKLYIYSKSNISPHIELDSGQHSTITGAKTLKMMFFKDSIWFSTKDFNPNADSSIVIGNNADSENIYNIAIGEGAEANCGDGIAIGREAKAIDGQQNSIAIGHTAESTGWNSTAVGENSKASKNASSAFGSSAIANNYASTAIGAGAQTSADHQIMLGNPNTTVYIPGNLVVQKDVKLSETTRNIMFGVNDHGSNNGGVYNIYKRADNDNKSNIFVFDSDRRLKNVGEAFKGGLEEIKKLEVFNYVYKKDPAKTPRVGVMAQDLQKIFPNAIFKGDDGFLRIRMEDMFYAVVNAIKELDKRIDLLVEKQKEINDLKTEVKTLKKQYNDLEKRLEKLEKRK